jgi:O-succinylbenzoate synthase
VTQLRDLLASAVPFALPLTRTFRGLDVREGLLVQGPFGWGEFAPFDDYSDEAAARWLNAAMEAALMERPAAVRDSILVNAIIPMCDANDAALMTREAMARGCMTIKVKVGSADLADDIARIAAIREVLGPTGAIRIDANASWSLDGAVTALLELECFGLEYAEQPCASADLRALRRRTSVPLAIDEGIRHSRDLDSLGRELAESADVAILKPQTLGGVAATLRLAERVRDLASMPVVISGSLDTSVGLSAVVAAAAAVPDLPFASGLGTGVLLSDDVVDTPLIPVDGRIAVGRVVPDESALARAHARVAPERRDFWRQRLTRAWAARERLAM